MYPIAELICDALDYHGIKYEMYETTGVDIIICGEFDIYVRPNAIRVRSSFTFLSPVTRRGKLLFESDHTDISNPNFDPTELINGILAVIPKT